MKKLLIGILISLGVIALTVTSADAHQKPVQPDLPMMPRMKPAQIPDGNAAPMVVAVAIEKMFPVAVAKVAKPTNQEYCLAQNVYFEARSETVEGMTAVALVTLNRVASKSYPKTICEVVWQRKQFSWTHDGKSDTPFEKLAWKIAKDVAASVLANYDTTGYDFTDGALWYHATYAKPYWRTTYTQTATIGAHIFYAKGI